MAEKIWKIGDYRDDFSWILAVAETEEKAIDVWRWQKENNEYRDEADDEENPIYGEVLRTGPLAKAGDLKPSAKDMGRFWLLSEGGNSLE